MMPKIGGMPSESRFGTATEGPAPETQRSNAAQQACGQRYQVRYFATLFLLMHVQGNQNVPICLEEKQCCTWIEQRKQLAREVPPAFDANATETRHGSLYTA
jgi:hypothetical protein